MSLCSLKKSTPSVERDRPVTVDNFIDEALTYASGKQVIHHLYPPTQEGEAQKIPGPMRRATFTLTESAIEHLTELSEKSGVSRSRIIRIWAENMVGEHAVMHIKKSETL